MVYNLPISGLSGKIPIQLLLSQRNLFLLLFFVQTAGLPAITLYQKTDIALLIQNSNSVIRLFIVFVLFLRYFVCFVFSIHHLQT